MSPDVVSSDEIKAAESAVLPTGQKYSADQLDYIRCLTPCSVQAYAGTGKTSVIVGKLHVLAQKQCWGDGRGVCVLSHTNVAVDEIKDKVAKHYPEVMSYPNFVGTIQEFANKFFFVPYLASNGMRIRFQEDKRRINLKDCLPANIVQRIASHLRGRMARAGEMARERFWENIGTLHIFNDKLCYEKNGASLEFLDLKTTAVPQEKIYLAFRDAILARQRDGHFLYTESFISTLDYLQKRPILRDILAQRFKYVFVDEAQDCSELQLSLIRGVFGDRQDTVLQEIGDQNQSLSQNVWVPGARALNLSASARFGTDAAKFVTNFKVTAGAGLIGGGQVRKHFLLTYDAGKERCVLPAYAAILARDSVPSRNGYYAISYTHAELLKYFKNYSEASAKNKKLSSVFKYDSDMEYIHRCTRDLVSRGGSNGVSRLLLHLLYKHRKVNGGSFSEMLQEIRSGGMGQRFHELVCYISRELVSAHGSLDLPRIETELNVILGASLVSFGSASGATHTNSKPADAVQNVFAASGVSIEIGTIHSVKGQTHDATLLLSGKYNGKQDFQHAIADTRKYGPKYKTMLYVAASRASHHFSVAIEKSAYNSLSKKDFFQGFSQVSI